MRARLHHHPHATRRQQRLKWYAERGVLPEEDGGGPNGILVRTSDERGERLLAT
ncbi:hypothetical protein AB0D65_00840 [Streptomyces griseoloalbus]|uniref:Uncharacterized protein n=1 Tax=Streptomyces griseoloalbus TaxID=67303 RepID=A0ABV3DXG6_9ACTN